MTKKYTQYDVDNMFNYMLNNEPLDWYDDCQIIKAAVRRKRNLVISTPAAFKMWKTASSWMDAGWLEFMAGEENREKEIIKCWDQFIDNWHKDS